MITRDNLQQKIEDALPMLFKMARSLTWNQISEDCVFILSEIRDSDRNFYEQWLAIKRENDRKVPVSFSRIMPSLWALHDNLYDINLHIYRADKDRTIIDIRYYPKSALGKDYRQTVQCQPPMLHCKVVTPPWLTDKGEQFDINWQHHLLRWRRKLFWARLKFKIGMIVRTIIKN